MIPEERYKRIREILIKEKTISLKELSNKVYASESTIRRDIDYLENSAFLRKIRGGVTLVSNKSIEDSSFVRKLENVEQKQFIAKLTSEKYLKNDISIFIDSSSTCNLLNSYLHEYNQIVVITNSISIATSLNDYDNIKVLLAGGRLKPNSYSVLGLEAYEFISNYYADYFFMSCKFIDNDGIYEADEDQAVMKKLMIQNSSKTILLADSSKFNKNSYISTINPRKIDSIVTDKKPDDDFLKKISPHTKIIWQ